MDWNALADAIIKVGNSFGLAVLGGGAVLAIIWKFLDSWGKRKKD